MGVELFDADEQTGVTEIIVVFRNFANAAKNRPVISSSLRSTVTSVLPALSWLGCRPKDGSAQCMVNAL
jgi:hypothetical protein